MQKIIPLILSGGAGTRLWPLSTEDRPKQFATFGAGGTLIENTLMRCRDGLFDARPIVISGEKYRFLVAEALRKLELTCDIILEPVARDSCAAVAAGCLIAQARSPQALVLVLAADHMISDDEAFSQAVAAARPDADDGKLVTFGIMPDRPETGYGYIKPGALLREAGCLQIERFVEKPNLATAQKYLTDGYYWNSGNFLFRADVFLRELAQYAPSILASTQAAVSLAVAHGDFTVLDSAAFSTSPRFSIDYAVMEKTAEAAVYPVNYQWSDIGSWDAVRDLLNKDIEGNAVVGPGTVIDGANNLVHATGIQTLLIGVEGLMVVTTPSGVLVTHEGQSAKLKYALAKIKSN
jgi:mannose-1-phosphate guanylyltransferase / mannose-6-phosphate isomerase